MAGSAGGALPLSDVHHQVDLEKERAWLAFRLDGREVRWTGEVYDDSIDAKILSRIAELLKAPGSGKAPTYLDLQGRDA
jgi:hypothetical protein